MTAAGGSGGERPASIDGRLRHAGLPGLGRLAWLEVDLGVLSRNARVLHGLLPAGAALGVVVKADGYGHGIEAAARAAVAGGASLLVVASLDEALVLRDAGLRDRILVLYPVPPVMLAVAVAADIDLVVADESSVASLAAFLRGGARHAGASAGDGPLPRVHLGIETGMGRGGLLPERAAAAAGVLLDAGLDRLAGTWSHLSTPEDAAVVAAQVQRFEAALSALRDAGVEPGIRHLDATGGLVGGAGPAYDLVRVGLAYYGVLPPELPVATGQAAAAARLAPAATLRARAATIVALPPGSTVGYGGAWVARRPSIVATVPVGYADGWARAYAGASWGVTRGVRVPAIGRVGSDALALDVTDVPGFGPENEVVLLGAAPAMTVHDLAGLRGSIAWEVLDAFTPRLARVYVDGERVVGVRGLDGRTQWAATAR